MSDLQNRPLRVCLVAPLPPPYGGIAHWTEMVTRHAGDCRHVKIVSVDIAPRWRSIHDLAVWKRVLGGGLQLLRDLLALNVVLFFRRPHVIHLTTSGHLSLLRDKWVLFFARLFRVPVVYHIRFGRVPQIARDNNREWRLMASAMQRAHAVIAIDSGTEKAIGNFLPSVNLKRIPNCINTKNLPRPKVQEGRQCTAVFIGWVVATKGIAELVDAWACVQPTGWQLLVIGPGDTSYQIQLLNKYRPEAVVFLGEYPHDQAMEILAQADLFILPSYTEGFPNVVLEAMALGKAILATDVGAIPEMLADGCGHLVKPRDTEGLATALTLLTADEQGRTAMGELARTRAFATFSLETVFASYMTVWQQVAESGLSDQNRSKDN